MHESPFPSDAEIKQILIERIDRQQARAAPVQRVAG